MMLFTASDAYSKSCGPTGRDDHVKLGHRMSQTPYMSRTGLNTYESFTRHTCERTEHTPAEV